MSNLVSQIYHFGGHVGDFLMTFFGPAAKMVPGTLLVTFLAPFWAPFGSLWIPFGPLWFPFASLWPPFGSLWLSFGSLLAPFGSLLLTLELHFLTFGLSGVVFLSLSYTFDENLIKYNVL